MYCEHCGTKIDKSHKFCTKCGNATDPAQVKATVTQHPVLALNDKWWHRLLKVLYIIVYFPLLGIVPMVWSSNVPYCYASYSCYGSYSEAFWYSVLTLVIYVVTIRLIKISVIYVAFGRKAEWKKEFKKPF